jgi:hypothetical protein
MFRHRLQGPGPGVNAAAFVKAQQILGSCVTSTLRTRTTVLGNDFGHNIDHPVNVDCGSACKKDPVMGVIGI